MSNSRSHSTCWTMILGAASGDRIDRDLFARRYEPIVRGYLFARWGDGVYGWCVEDAVQDVFIECFRDGGALSRVDPERPGGFRAFFFGVIRNVALRFERKHARSLARKPSEEVEFAELKASEKTASKVFERAWARAVMKEAVDKLNERAASAGEEALKRAALLRLRFQEGLPIREIAARWDLPAEQVHRQYARARKDFKSVLLEVVEFYNPGSNDLDAECSELLGALRESS